MTVYQKRRAVWAWVAASIVATIPAAPAQAALGRPDTIIADERLQARAQLRVLQHADHMRHELTMPNGGWVHEFANDSGQVFAVTWSGPGKPDLRSLLGDHFTQLMAATAEGRALRRPAQVNRVDLQIQTGGHMGYFWGVAYLPGLAPSGFDTAALN